MPTFYGQIPSGRGEFEPKSAKFTRKYLVELDTFADDADAACLIAGVPAGYSTHPSYPLATVQHQDAERIGNTRLWIVSIDFETSEAKSTETDNPLLDMAEVGISYEEREYVIRGAKGSGRTYTGALKSSNGEIFNPPPTEQAPVLVMDIKKNYVNTYDVFTTALSYMDTINNTSWNGFPAHTVKCCNVSPKTDNRNDITFLAITFTFKVNPNTWDKILLDAGTYYLNDAGEQIEFKTKDGHSRQGTLNGSGKALGSGSAEVYLPAIQTKMAVDFSGLDIFSTGYKFV